MAKTYGIPYQGSKSTIANWVIDNLPQSDTLIDLFAGGCAITHAALESGKYKHVIANDLTDAPNIFMAAIEGQFEGFSYVPTREEFKNTDDDAIRLLYSFSNARDTYLWSKELEPVKVAASKMVSAPSEYERRMHYRTFMRELREYIKRNNKMPDCDRAHDGGLQGLEGLQRLQRLEGLQRLQRLQGLEGLQRLQGLEGLQVFKRDYQDIDIPKGATVYADPPYRGTECRAYGGFDWERFDSWLDSVGCLVVVSEYTAPTNCVEVASKVKRCDFGSKADKRCEKLFVHKRYEQDYYKLTGRMKLA